MVIVSAFLGKVLTDEEEKESFWQPYFKTVVIGSSLKFEIFSSICSPLVDGILSKEEVGWLKVCHKCNLFYKNCLYYFNND